MKYTTQMDAAKKGIITDEMKDVVKNEGIKVEDLMRKMVTGKVIIPANKNHKSLRGIAIGEGLRTKVNVNLGVSENVYNLENELEKVKKAIEYRADSIMDLSTFGPTKNFRKMIVEESEVMLGTVPMYDAVAKYGKKIEDITVDNFFEVAREHAEDGIDFLTIHAGLNSAAVDRVKNNDRLTNIVSRGGSILYEWMVKNKKENPFYEHFDRLLDICEEFDVTLSLGDGLRPGSIKDATDAAQIQELIILGELTKKAWERNIQVMIEGPGHVPINEIETNVQIQKKLCHGAPFYVLGPLVTDIAPGYDHITSAIGGALAASKGVDFLCYVTPAEHLRLPDLDDMKEGIMATRIAAHAGDIAKGVNGAKDWDNSMSKARRDLDWSKMFKLALDSKKARDYRLINGTQEIEECTMCGDLCAVKRYNDIK